MMCPTGHNANSEERKKAMRTAEDFIKDMNYAQNTQVSFHNRNGQSDGRTRQNQQARLMSTG